MKTINEIDSISNHKNLFLTTFDNSFDPFKEFDRWWKEDLLLGHDCCGLLARESNTSDIASDEVNEKDIVQAMKDIVRNEPMIYRVVTNDDE